MPFSILNFLLSIYKIVDTQIFFIINGTHNAFFDSFFYLVSQRTVWIPLYVSILYVVWRNYSWRGVLSILLMIGFGMLFTDWANSHFLRPWIGRLRPSNPENPIAPLVHLVNGRHGNGYGFPSCHSANIWLITFVSIYWLRNRWVTLTLSTTAILWCYSRVYLAFHYPGDILGGFILALLVAGVLCKTHSRYMHHQPIMPVRQRTVPAMALAIILLYMIINAAVV